MKTYKCHNCSREFLGYPSQRPKFCSRACVRPWIAAARRDKNNLAGVNSRRQQLADARTKLFGELLTGGRSAREIADTLGISRNRAQQLARELRAGALALRIVAAAHRVDCVNDREGSHDEYRSAVLALRAEIESAAAALGVPLDAGRRHGIDAD